jgi:hypothetical protein
MAGLSVPVTVSGYLPFIPRSEHRALCHYDIVCRKPAHRIQYEYCLILPRLVRSLCDLWFPLPLTIPSNFPTSTTDLVIALNLKSCNNRAYTSRFHALYFGASYQRRNPHQEQQQFCDPKNYGNITAPHRN